MNKIIKSIVFIFIFFLIVGCGGATPSPSSADLPAWYLNQPASDSSYYYGVGNGATKEEARTSALAQVGGEISTNVSSSMDVSIHTTSEEYTKNVELKTKSSIGNIKFTGVEIIENKLISGKIYTYLKVDRKVLFTAQKKVMDSKYNKLTSLYKHSKENNIFSLIKNRSKIQASEIDIRATLSVLKTINASFDDTKYSKELNTISNDTQNAISDAMVYVTNKNAAPFQEVLENYISSLGMTLVSSTRSVKNKKNLLQVDVSKISKKKMVKTSDPRLAGASFAEIIITISTKDYRNKVIAQNRIKVVNISKEGYKAASVKTQKFEREIKRKGILNILLDKSLN